jgi:hypothetical protein
MKLPIIAAIAFTFSLLAGSDVVAAPCAGPDKDDGFCRDRELVALRQAAEVKLKRLAADPLTAMLMRRDQRWFLEIVHGEGGTGPFEGKDDPERLRMKALLEGRIAALGVLAAGAAPEGPAGRWTNALGSATVDKRGDGLAVTLSAEPDYGIEGASCGMTAELKLHADGWYVGTPVPKEQGDDNDQNAQGVSSADRIGDKNIGDKDKDDPQPVAASGKSELRLRLQGNTLRVVVVRDDEVSLCAVPEMITGTYFPVGPGTGHTGNPAAHTVLPSFNCASAKNNDEEEICADPDLARLDGEIARTYRDSLRRLDAKLTSQLRDDQRAWAKGNGDAFDTFLHPYWDKQYFMLHQTGNVRQEWETRLRERLAMLANLDETRTGLAGHWLAYNAMVAILPAKDKPDGTLRAQGGTWVTGAHKYHCEFDGEGRIVGNTFKPNGGDDFPKIRREGATMMVDGEDSVPNRNRDQPGYCSRLKSAKARLFPVKPAGYKGNEDDRIR